MPPFTRFSGKNAAFRNWLIVWVCVAGFLGPGWTVCSEAGELAAPCAATEAGVDSQKRVVIRNSELVRCLTGETLHYPTYTTQLINLASRNAQATRPRVVGQLSDLIHEYPGDSYSEWVGWYRSTHPEAIETASRKIWQMLKKMESAMEQIDESMVRRWVEDLVLAKTYAGLRIQESVLKTIAEGRGMTYRLANPAEESRGIDGFIGGRPVSVKPVSYRSQAMLAEQIAADMIYYEKVPGGVAVYFNF